MTDTYREGQIAYFRGRQYEISELYYQSGSGGRMARLYCPVYGGNVETHVCNLETSPPVIGTLIPMPRRGWVPVVIEGGVR